MSPESYLLHDSRVTGVLNTRNGNVPTAYKARREPGGVCDGSPTTTAGPETPLPAFGQLRLPFTPSSSPLAPRKRFPNRQGGTRASRRGEGGRGEGAGRAGDAVPVSEEDSVLLTGALQQETAWTEMSFSITLTLTGVLRGESAGKTPVTGAPEPRLDPATGR